MFHSKVLIFYPIFFVLQQFIFYLRLRDFSRLEPIIKKIVPINNTDHKNLQVTCNLIIYQAFIQFLYKF